MGLETLARDAISRNAASVEMAVSHFEDLTPYVYCHPEQERPGTVNIGWIDRWHSFPTGKTSQKFQAKLKQLCLRRVNQMRGFHPCDFCKGRNKPQSSAEIRVFGDGRIYAAPELVSHYVEAHHYKPPEEFITAVLNQE